MPHIEALQMPCLDGALLLPAKRLRIDHVDRLAFGKGQHLVNRNAIHAFVTLLLCIAYMRRAQQVFHL